MNTYIVKIPEVHIAEIQVEASNEKEAIQKASEIISSSDVETYYDYTLEEDEWTVEKLEESANDN